MNKWEPLLALVLVLVMPLSLVWCFAEVNQIQQQHVVQENQVNEDQFQDQHSGWFRQVENELDHLNRKWEDLDGLQANQYADLVKDLSRVQWYQQQQLQHLVDLNRISESEMQQLQMQCQWLQYGVHESLLKYYQNQLQNLHPSCVEEEDLVNLDYEDLQQEWLNLHEVQVALQNHQVGVLDQNEYDEMMQQIQQEKQWVEDYLDDFRQNQRDLKKKLQQEYFVTEVLYDNNQG